MQATHAYMYVLFFSRPRSEGSPHHGRTFSVYLCPLSFRLTLPRGSSIHVLMLSIQAVRGLPRPTFLPSVSLFLLYMPIICPYNCTLLCYPRRRLWRKITVRITDCNFTDRMLYRDMYWRLYILDLHLYSCVQYNCGLIVHNKRICYVILCNVRPISHSQRRAVSPTALFSAAPNCHCRRRFSRFFARRHFRSLIDDDDDDRALHDISADSTMTSPLLCDTTYLSVSWIESLCELFLSVVQSQAVEEHDT